MTPPLCPLCGRRASERVHWEGVGYGICRETFHNAADWGPALLEVVDELLDGLDANHDGRDGLSDKQWDARVKNARSVLDAVEGKEE